MTLLLVAAMAAPPPKALGPDALPAWSVPSGEASLEGAWWEAFGDPDLTAILESALRSNRDLRALFARTRAARAQGRAGLAPLLPQIRFDANAQVAPTASRGFQFGGIPTLPGQPEPPKTYTVGQAAFTGTWDVDLFFRNQQGAAASLHDARAAEGDRDAAVLAFAARVAEGYFDVIAARRRLALVQAQVATAEELLSLVDLRYQAGDASAVELLQQRQSTAQIRSQLPLAEAAVASLERQLAVALGLPPAAPLPPMAQTLPDPPPLPDAGIPADLVLARPDLRAADRKIEAASARRRQAVRQLLPTLRLQGSAGWQFFEETEFISQTFWNAGASVQVPLFGGGRTQQLARAARAQEDAAIHSYTQLAAQAVLEVETALLQERSRAAHLDIVREQLRAAREAFDEARERYVRGVGNHLNLLTAQNAHYAAELAYLDSQRQLLSARIQLYDALGGSWIGPISQSLGATR